MLNQIVIASALALTLSATASSAGTGRDNQVGDALSSHVDAHVVTIYLSGGLHFNDKAPNTLVADSVSVKPSQQQKQKLQFELAKQDPKNLDATVYVCDDALTFCEPHLLHLRGTAGSSQKVSAAASPPAVAHINKYGFIEDSLVSALQQAKAKKQSVLVDFGARWCPGCVRLETEVFSQHAFVVAGKSFIKVRLDVDRFENSVLKEKYAIISIPTLMALTSDGEEIARLVDYQPMQTITAFLQSTARDPVALDTLKEKQKSGDSAAAKVLGKRLYAAGRFEESVQAFSAAGANPPIELLDAKVQTAANLAKKDPAAKPNLVKTLKDAITQEPLSSRSVVWRSLLVGAIDNKDEKKKIADEGVAVAEKILAKPQNLKSATNGDLVGEFSDFEGMLVASEAADLIEAAGAPEEEQLKAWQKVADIGRAAKIPITRKGPSLRLLIFLTAAHEYEEAEKLARALLAHDHDNPELQRRLTRILNEQKKYSEAIDFGRKSLAHSYGQNELWVAEQLAKAYIGAGKKQEARALLEDYLGRTESDWPEMQVQRRKFSDLLSSISGDAKKSSDAL